METVVVAIIGAYLYWRWMQGGGPGVEGPATLEAPDSIVRKAKKIAGLINAAKSQQPIRELAIMILQGKFAGPAVPEMDYLGEINQLFGWVKNHVRYTRDPEGVDMFENPIWTIGVAAGDCDAQVITLGALLQAVGNPVQLKVASYDGIAYSHVYLQAQNPYRPSQWITADPTLVGAQLGMEKPYIKARTFPV